MNSVENLLLHKLQIKLPLILAPLAGGPSTPELAAAVANSGGMGSLGLAYSTPENILETMKQTRALTHKPIAINLFIPSPEPKVTTQMLENAIAATMNYRKELNLPEPTLSAPYAENFDHQFEAMLKAKPTAFSFIFGILPKIYMDQCKKQNIFTIGTATNLHEALSLEESGADAIVAQGIEAGGHRGLFIPDQGDTQMPTTKLVQQVSAKVRTPVIAAGGIMNGQNILTAMQAGAQSVQMGTAFLLCAEAGTSAPYRAALSDPQHKTTKLTRAFSGRIARGIENKFMREMNEKKDFIMPFPAQNVFTRDLRKKSAENNSADYLSLWAGQNVDLITKAKAKDIVETLFTEL